MDSRFQEMSVRLYEDFMEKAGRWISGKILSRKGNHRIRWSNIFMHAEKRDSLFVVRKSPTIRF